MTEKTKLAVVPRGHQKMVSAIKQLPDIRFITKYRDQRVLLFHQKNFWKFIGIRIDFFQLVQLGYTPLDLLIFQELHPFHYGLIDVMSHYYFSILQVVIQTFSIIREVAIRKKRSFPFNNPRELFEQICRDDANGGTTELRSNELNQGFNLKTLRKNLRMCHKFYREALPEKEHNEFLLELQTGDWSGFWIFAILQGKEKTPLKNTWENFKDAHKAVCQFMDKDDYPDGKVTMTKFNAGKAYCSRSVQPIDSWGIWDDDRTLNIS